MKVEINYKPIEAPRGIKLEELLRREGIALTGAAVAVDNKVVPRRDLSSFEVEEGMKITVIRAVCGG